MRKRSKIVDELLSVLSQDAIDKLLAARGGTSVYIPAKLSPHHWLVDVLGMEDAAKLCRHLTVDFGRGCRFDLPIESTRDETINRAIDRMDAAGHSSSQIALALRITERRVQRRRAARRAAE